MDGRATRKGKQIIKSASGGESDKLAEARGGARKLFTYSGVSKAPKSRNSLTHFGAGKEQTKRKTSVTFIMIWNVHVAIVHGLIAQRKYVPDVIVQSVSREWMLSQFSSFYTYRANT